MRVVAFDFETAGRKSLSACELGLAVFESGNHWKLAELRGWRFAPCEGQFEPRHTEIHGISSPDVDGLYQLRDLWPQIAPYFNADVLVAHRAFYDVGILCDHLDNWGVDRPSSRVACTMQLARQHLPELPSFALESLCKYFRIPLQSHQATSDAAAAGYLISHLERRAGRIDLLNTAEIDLRYWKRSTIDAAWDDEDGIFDGSSVSISFDDILPSATSSRQTSRWLRGQAASSVSDDLELVRQAEEFHSLADRSPSTTLLSGWKIAVTGDLALGRDHHEITYDVLRLLGAKVHPKGDIVKTNAKGNGPTNVVIVSESHLQEISNHEPPRKKIEKALLLEASGKPCTFISESNLYKTITSATLSGISSIPHSELIECESFQHIRRLASPPE